MTKQSNTHPSRGKLEAFLHGTMKDGERRRIEKHVGDCDACCDVLRSIPPDPFVDRLRSASSAGLEETQGLSGPSPTPGGAAVGSIPKELVDHPRYRIIRPLGAGGMGVVYQAEHRLMERPVALKVISADLVSSEVAVERFRLEVKAAAKLSHRNIVAAYDAEQAGALHFLVMEYIEGASLSELVKRKGRLPVTHACNYVVQAAKGLQHAFEHAMVHRDVKPHNLMRTAKGTIKILDFGLARFASEQSSGGDTGLTGEHATLGTPDYIAPEQARDSRRADVRSDVYSLGCTLFYLLAGRVPFPDGNALSKVVSHCECPPPRLAELRDDVPAEVAAVVERMMAKNPDDRFQTPGEVADALKPFARPGKTEDKDEAADALLSAIEGRESELLDAPTFVDGDPFGIQDAKTQADQEPAVAPEPPPAKQESPPWFKHRAAAMVAGLAALAVIGFFMFRPTREGDGRTARDVERPPKKPSATPAPTPPAPGESSRSSNAKSGSTNWINLVAQVNLGRDVVAGNWQRDSSGALRSDSGANARLVFPFSPPAEYDFEATFTRHDGVHSVALHFVAGSGQGTFDIDAWGESLSGIQCIDGRDMREYRAQTTTFPIVNGQTYTALVRVRADGVEAYIDGELLASYRGDGSDLSMLDLWQLPNSRQLGVGAYESNTTFHQVRVRPADSSAP